MFDATLCTKPFFCRKDDLFWNQGIINLEHLWETIEFVISSEVHKITFYLLQLLIFFLKKYCERKSEVSETDGGQSKVRQDLMVVILIGTRERKVGSSIDHLLSPLNSQRHRLKWESCRTHISSFLNTNTVFFSLRCSGILNEVLHHLRWL